MPGYGFYFTRIFSYKNKTYDFALIWKNMSEKKPVFCNGLCSVNWKVLEKTTPTRLFLEMGKVIYPLKSIVSLSIAATNSIISVSTKIKQKSFYLLPARDEHNFLSIFWI